MSTSPPADAARTVAAIDCGTNSIRLLVASMGSSGRLDAHVRTMRVVRLGEGVDRTGRLADAALARTFAAIDEYAGVIADHRAGRIRFVATSATRDAVNREVFVDGVRARLGVEPEVVSGRQEAALSFAGAVRGLPQDRLRLPALVVDIGGGSTEFVLGAAEPDFAASVDVGCVRMTERHLQADPPTQAEVRAAAADIEAALAHAGRLVPMRDAACVVGLAGSVTTVAAMAMDLPEYDESVLHGAVVARGDVDRVTARLLAMTRAERARLPFMHPGRVDVIAGGALVLSLTLAFADAAEVVVSETDILDGIAYSILDA